MCVQTNVCVQHQLCNSVAAAVLANSVASRGFARTPMEPTRALPTDMRLAMSVPKRELRMLRPTLALPTLRAPGTSCMRIAVCSRSVQRAHCRALACKCVLHRTAKHSEIVSCTAHVRGASQYLLDRPV